MCDNSRDVLISPRSCRSQGTNAPGFYPRVAACQTVALLLASKVVRFAGYMFKRPIFGSCQECGDLCLSVEQDGAGREPGVAHRDLSGRQRGQFDALPVRVAVPALLPADVSELRGEHAVIGNDHVYPLSTG